LEATGRGFTGWTAKEGERIPDRRGPVKHDGATGAKPECGTRNNGEHSAAARAAIA